MTKRLLIPLLLLMAMVHTLPVEAQPDGQDKEGASREVLTNSFWSNWYVQGALAMTLQNPCNHNFSETFPKGKTLGIEAAVGKWFTPAISLRFKMLWSNFMGGVFENHHLEWVGPMGRNGINHDKGGFVAFCGDILFNLTYYIYGYDEKNPWTVCVYPRMGGIANFGNHYGSPLMGGGVMGAYRINDRWSVHVDGAYHMMSSGFLNDPSASTGVGSNSNGYFDFSVGVTLNLGKSAHTPFSRPDRTPVRRVGWHSRQRPLPLISL